MCVTRNKAIDLVGANDTATRQMLKVAMVEREKAMNATLETSARSGGLSGSSGTLFSRTGTMGMHKAQSMESLDMAGPSYARNGSRMGTLNNQIGDRFAGNSVVSGYSLGQPTLKSAQSVPSLADDSSYMEPVEAIKQYQQQQRRQQSNASPVDDEYATINDVKQRQLSKKQKAISLSTSALDDDMSEMSLVKTKSKKKSKKSKERLLSQDTEVTMNDAEESTVFDDAQSLDDLQVTAPKTKKKKKKGTTKKVKEPVVQDPTDSDQSMDFDSVSQIMEPPPPPQFARTKLRATMPVKLTSEDQKKVEKATADPKIQTWVQDQNAYAKKRSQTPPPSTLDDVGGKPSKTKLTTRQPPPPAADNRLSMESEFSDVTSVTGTHSLGVAGGGKPSIVHIEVDDKQVPGRTIIRVIPVQNADGLDDDVSTVVSDATSTWDAGTVISDAETLRSLSSIPAKQRPPPPTKPKPAVMPRPTNTQPAPVQFQKIPPAASVQSQDNTSKTVATPVFNKPAPPISSKSVVQPSLSTPAPAVAAAGKKPAIAIEKQVTAAKDAESDSTDSSSGDEDEQVVSAKPAPAAASPLTKPKQPILPKEPAPAPASPLTKPKQPILPKEPVTSTAAASTGQSGKASGSQPTSNEGRGVRQKHNSMGEVDITGYLDYSSTDVSPPKPAKVSFAGVNVGKQQQQQHQGMAAPSPSPTLNRELSRSEDSLQSYTSWNREKQQAPILTEIRNTPVYSSQRKPSTRSQEDLLQQQQAYQPQQLGQGQGQAVEPSRSSRMPPTRYALPGMARPPGPAAPGANAPISQGQFPRPQVVHVSTTLLYYSA